MVEYGYKIKDGKVVIHDTNSQAVIAMHEWYLKSDSIYSVLAFLGASEYISPGGMKKWTRATVRKILGNPIYKGTDIFPRILPDQVIDQVNEAFERKNKRKSSEQKQSQLLIANVFCNECGSLMQPCGHHKDIYECKCSSISINFVKEAFTALSSAIYQDPSIVEHFELEQMDSNLFESINSQINEAINNVQYSHYNVVCLLKQRAALAYKHSKLNESEMKSMKILNSFFRKDPTDEFDVILYSCTVQKVTVIHSDLIKVELINGQEFEFMNE